MKKLILSALVATVALPLAGFAQMGTTTGKQDAGSGEPAVPSTSATPMPTPMNPSPNDPNGVGQASGSGKGPSGAGTGAATQGGMNQ